MQMAMMHGMMGMAMMQQMGQMGMMPPGYLHSMAAQQAQMMMADKDGKASRKRRRKSSRAKQGATNGGAARHSSSSSSDSSSDSEDDAGVLPPPAAMAAMAAMWPGAAGPPGPNGHPAPVEDVEAFLAANPVDPEAADRLRALPPHLQQAVVQRGPVSDTRNPSAVLIARVRDVELRGGGAAAAGPLGAPAGVGAALPTNAAASGDPDYGAVPYAASTRGGSPKPARRSAKVTIESMIRDYRLSPGCAWMLRALPPDKQKLAARIDPAGQSDPSGYVAEQLKKIV